MAVEKPENAGAATPQAGEPTPADVTLVGDGRPQADMSPGRPAMPAGEEEEEEDEKKHSAYSILMMSIALMSAIFLVALDVNILATAIPKITSDFGTLNDIAWYGAAYALANMALQPTFGRLYAAFPLKVVFCAAVGLFGAGSAVCAAAPASAVLVAGRAVQGAGVAGTMAGGLTLCTYVVSRRRLPLFVAAIGSVYALASVLGPVLGGAFADSHLTWRFCFWINLPIGALAVLLTWVAFKEPVRESTKKPLREKLATLDPVSTLILIGAMACLVLALQWGGATRPWSDPKVWGCLLGFALTLCLFVALQVRHKEKALIPIHVLTQRTVAASCAATTCLMIGMNTLTNYVPFYLQATKGMSPSLAGLYVLALAVPSPAATLATGGAASLTGHYVPWMVASGAVLAVGAGLLSTLDRTSGTGPIVGFEVLASLGFGLGVQLPLTAIRNALREADLPLGNALFVFFQGLGTTLAASVAQAVFLGALHGALRADLAPADAARVVDLGAAAAGSGALPPAWIPLVAAAYRVAVRGVMYYSAAAAALACVVSGLLEWKKLPVQKKPSRRGVTEDAQPAAAAAAAANAEGLAPVAASGGKGGADAPTA